jgi:hypothetical protein
MLPAHPGRSLRLRIKPTHRHHVPSLNRPRHYENKKNTAKARYSCNTAYRYAPIDYYRPIADILFIGMLIIVKIY